MDLDLQMELFDQAMLELAAMPDMVNQVLEISLEPDDRIRVRRYLLPPEQG